LLDLCGDAEGARTALVQATDSGHPFLAPRAALALGLIQLAAGNPASACDAYRRAIGYDNSDLTPTAWLYLGAALVELGEISAAQAAMRQAIESRQDYLEGFAAHWLELLTSHERDLESARAVFRPARSPGAPLYKDRLLHHGLRRRLPCLPAAGIRTGSCPTRRTVGFIKVGSTGLAGPPIS
jgi:tetratricopeptide (TPR) repeat protein